MLESRRLTLNPRSLHRDAPSAWKMRRSGISTVRLLATFLPSLYTSPSSLSRPHIPLLSLVPRMHIFRFQLPASWLFAYLYISPHFLIPDTSCTPLLPARHFSCLLHAPPRIRCRYSFRCAPHTVFYCTPNGQNVAPERPMNSMTSQ
ncbi:hypothetical protein DENSPDRAFT_257368 [Dentipellis sp. KUC8613]|nr:hypothetical protein DENSPDRAFT_257368 [Dentipellis sp. KUC8613]